MAERAANSRLAIGFTVKSGWAAAVLLRGPVRSPQVVDSCRVELSDPADPESRQPYHAGFGTPRADDRERARLLHSVRRFGMHSVTGVIRRYQAEGRQVIGAGVVAGSLIDPERIANAHIRIHALEGQLFRTLIEDAARENGLSCSVWRERDLYAAAAGGLKQSEPQLRRAVKALGDTVEGAWRSEQKAAAIAAWLLLST